MQEEYLIYLMKMNTKHLSDEIQRILDEINTQCFNDILSVPSYIYKLEKEYRCLQQQCEKIKKELKGV